MEFSAKSIDAAAASLAREGSQATLALVRDLTWDCLWASAWRLPLALAACVLPCLIMALLPAAALANRGACPLATGSGMFVVLTLYVAAGLVWGVHATIHRGVLAGVAAFERRVPALFDVLTAPLVVLGSGHLPTLPLADVRQYFARATDYPDPAHSGPRWRQLRRLAGILVRWCLRAQGAVVEQVLDRIEQSGQTHVSLASLKTCARDELITRTARAARLQLFQFDLAAGAVVLGLLVVPAALVIWLAG